MKKELETDSLTSTEKPQSSFGKVMENLGAHAKETVTRAQSTIAHAVDKKRNRKSTQKILVLPMKSWKMQAVQ